MTRAVVHAGVAHLPEPSPKPILILGIGNILMSDDGIGVRVIEAMRDLALPEEVEILDGGTAGASLVDAIADRKKLIIIDAMDAGDAPGAIRRLAPKDIERTGGMSLHDVGLIDALHASRLLGVAPTEVVIIGVQITHITIGLELSEPLSQAVPLIIRQATAEAQGLPLDELC